MTHLTQFQDEYCTSQDNLYGMYCPMDVKQDLSYWDPAGIPLNEAEVPRSGVTSFTRPLLSDSALPGGRNWRNPTTRYYTADTGQMSGMSFCPNYYGQSKTSAPPNADTERPMNIQNFHQSCFPSIHQVQPSISMQSSDPVKLSPHTSSFDGFEHTTGVSSSYPHQSAVFTQNPYSTPSSLQGGHSSGSTCMYESAPAVYISGRAYYDSASPTISDMGTSSYDQVQPSFITSYFDGYEHTMGISSSSYPDQHAVFNQSPYHDHLQPSIDIPSLVQEGYSSGASCIYESDPSIDGISSGDWDDPRWSTDTNPNRTTLHETLAASLESPMVLCPLQSDHYQYPTVETTPMARAPPQSSKPFCHFKELKVSEPSQKSNVHDVRIAQIENSMKHLPINGEKTKTFECQECQKKFRYRSNLTNHLTVHTKEKPFECNECGRKFCYERTLKAHRDRIHCGWKPYECEKCGQKFRYNYTLETHCSKVHFGGDRFFTCSICGRKVLCKKSLDRHYRSVHVDIETFECSKCGQKLRSKRSSERHYNSVHLDIKPFECTKCSQKFDRKDSLKAHYDRVHLALKGFKCETCVRSFSSKNGLKKHSCNKAI